MTLPAAAILLRLRHRDVMHFVQFALLGWIPIALCLFAVMKPRHAVLCAYIGAWLFLPVFGIKINLLPDLTKVSVSSLGVLLGVMLFDPTHLLSFRPRWFDLPMLLFCITPYFSSMQNGLGAWDGCSAILQNVIFWGIPYFIGRIYFNDWESFRDLAVAIFIGGVIYIPLCLIEMRLSPQLHRWVYGYYQHSFNQTRRFGGYRPMAFMQSGLALSMWMTCACLVGVWLWTTGTMKHLWGVAMAWPVVALLITTVLCKSVASLLFLVMGLGALFWIRSFRNAFPLYVIIAIAPLYMLLRASGTWDAQNLVDTVSSVVGPQRAQSLQTRITAENRLTEKALQRPWLGWGRWSPDTPGKAPWRIYDERGKDIAPTDGMWVITFGTDGLIGLLAITTAILMPPILLRRRVPLAYWGHPLAAPAAALAIMLTLHMLDNLLNAMLNPIFVLGMGGLAVLGSRTRQPAVQRHTYGVPRGFGGISQPMAAQRTSGY